MIESVRFAVRLLALFTSGIAILSVASLVALAAIPSIANSAPAAERQAALRNLLTQDCGSCHGLTLAGGLGPPIQPQDLAGKPREYLTATILYGRPGTAMPPWRLFLSDEEAAWLSHLLLQRTP